MNNILSYHRKQELFFSNGINPSNPKFTSRKQFTNDAGNFSISYMYTHEAKIMS